jgi:HK97 family phage portal protein
VSPIEECLPEAELLYRINEYERQMVVNNGRPDFVVKYGAGSLEPERRRALGRMWRQMFTGTRRGEPFIADSDFSVEPLGWSPRDMSYQDGKRHLIMVVSNAFGVPMDMISPENSNRATSLTAFRSYAMLTVVPKLARYAEVITSALCPRYDDGLFVACDDPTPLDEEQEQKETYVLLQTGVLSVNEVRARMGLAPLPVDLRGSPERHPGGKLEAVGGMAVPGAGVGVAPGDPSSVIEQIREEVARILDDRLGEGK